MAKQEADKSYNEKMQQLAAKEVERRDNDDPKSSRLSS
jgi:hypothetical protein